MLNLIFFENAVCLQPIWKQIFLKYNFIVSYSIQTCLFKKKIKEIFEVFKQFNRLGQKILNTLSFLKHFFGKFVYELSKETILRKISYFIYSIFDEKV